LRTADCTNLHATQMEFRRMVKLPLAVGAYNANPTRISTGDIRSIKVATCTSSFCQSALSGLKQQWNALLGSKREEEVGLMPSLYRFETTIQSPEGLIGSLETGSHTSTTSFLFGNAYTINAVQSTLYCCHGFLYLTSRRYHPQRGKVTWVVLASRGPTYSRPTDSPRRGKYHV
jgi:hypothetical protein